jgi:peptide/nickel transport system substrate-binding protein
LKGSPLKIVIIVVVLLILVVGTVVYLGVDRPVDSGNSLVSKEKAEFGGTLAATYRSEPAGYNSLVSIQAAVDVVRLLTQDSLVRVNRVTGQLEPRLASEWTSSPDGLSWTLHLREGVVFSDGTPFTSADVVFTFQALYDPVVASEVSGNFEVDGKALVVAAPDAETVTITLPAPYGPGLAILDGLPILPAHALGSALASGTFRDAWRAGATPVSIVGLGPFRLVEHRSGERLRFERNEHFWNVDEDGRQLPYLDAIELRVFPEQNAEILQLESGAADIVSDAIRPEDIPALTRRAEAGALQIVKAGVSPDADGLWFNLVPNAPATARRPWLTSTAFRRAVSMAVDRQAIVDTVYLGEAVPLFGPVTPGHGGWFVADLPQPSHDLDAAQALLAEAGLRDADGDGLLDDASGAPARFSILTQAGHTARQRTVSVIQEELRKVGLSVAIETADPQTLFGRFGGGQYDTIYFGFQAGTIDPVGLAAFWMSSGPLHVWNPGQTTPATNWEARIDDLFNQQATTLDRAERIRLFAEAQRLFATELPMIHFAAPSVTVAMNARVGGALPSVLLPPVLWNAERLFVTSGAPGAQSR